jgi:glycine/D-amino acid oxidase-like deaminating enzyme
MTSLWQANITRRSAPLSGSVNADITVIGGGITGLSAALHCARLMPGARIVLLERGRVGDGSTGRSSGVLSTETALADEPELHSAPSSGIATDIPKNPFEHLIGFIEAEAIDCDLQLTGSRAMRMPHAKGGPKVTTASEAGRGFSDRSHLTGAVRIHPLPISWATIHPVKLLNGLRAMAEEAGVTIYESTEVVSLRDGVTLGCMSRDRLGGDVLRSPVHQRVSAPPSASWIRSAASAALCDRDRYRPRAIP